MTTGDGRVQARAIALVQLIAVVDHSQIDLGPFGGIVGLVQLQPPLVNMRLELQRSP